MITFLPRLVAILTSLRLAVAAYAATENRVRNTVWIGTRAYREAEDPNQPPKLPVETWTLLWHRLGRLANRFRALFTSWQAGTLPPPRAPRAPRPYTPRETPRLPAARGWINARIPAAAPCAGMLEFLLQDPELPGFLAQVPQAGRLLRPLVRALALTAPACLKLPARPKPTPKPRPTPPPIHAGTPDRPLPPYIRAAVRAWKKYDR